MDPSIQTYETGEDLSTEFNLGEVRQLIQLKINGPRGLTSIDTRAGKFIAKTINESDDGPREIVE